MSDGSTETAEFLNQLQGLFEKVEELAQERHDAGAAVYGPFKFLENDTLDMAIEEVVDLMNYCRYTAVKLLLLQRMIADKATAAELGNTTGGFIPTSEVLGKRIKPE